VIFAGAIRRDRTGDLPITKPSVSNRKYSRTAELHQTRRADDGQARAAPATETLRNVNWVIGGVAAKLGLLRTTLIARMRRMSEDRVAERSVRQPASQLERAMLKEHETKLVVAMEPHTSRS
jgi:hypothetical protein